MLNSIRRLLARNVLHCPIWKPLFTKCSVWAQSPECGGQEKMQKLESYDIPKDTVNRLFNLHFKLFKIFLNVSSQWVLLHFWAMSKNPNHWEDERAFRPERFLDDRSEKTIIFWPSQLAKDNVLEKHLPAPKCSSSLQTFCKSTT